MRISFRTDSEDNRPADAPGGAGRAYHILLVSVLGIAALAIVSSFIGDGGVTVIYQQSRHKKLLAAGIQREEARRETLLARIEGLKHDPLEVERMAREELGLVRESEIVYDFREAGPR